MFQFYFMALIDVFLVPFKVIVKKDHLLCAGKNS